MGDAAGQLVHGLHLLRLAERGLDLVKLGRGGGLLGDVPADGIEQAAVGRRVRRRRPGEGDGLAVRFQKAHLELVHRLAAPQGRQGLRGRGQVIRGG
jgi:hypothetical protein